MRILIGPVEVAGIAAGLKTGFDRLGVEADLVLSQPHPFGYATAAGSPRVARVWMGLGTRLTGARRFARPFFWALWKAWSVAVWLWALARYDGFIFLFGSSLTGLPLEAWLYRLLGKKVAVVFCGSDSRPPYVDGHVCHSPESVRPVSLERTARRLKRRIARYEGCGFVLVNAPCGAHFHQKPFVNWFDVGVPRDPPSGQDRTEGPARPDGPVRIVHSPSNPRAKGTATVRAIVERLRGEGHEIELSLLQGLSNREVAAALAGCDFVIDQCWSDSPMAAFAAEAAHFGKPALVGGYAATEADRGAFTAAPPPSLFVHPDALEDAARTLVIDADGRRALGRSARAFVSGRWAPERVAGRYLALLERGAEPEQLVDPCGISYVHGYALPEEAARAIVAALVRERGAKALQLGHNPKLERAFVRFAEGLAESAA